jgi:FkbM family methyltransferase
MIKDLIRKMIPSSVYLSLSIIYRRFKPRTFPIHLTNVFGFDIYQINNDINYEKFDGLTFDSLPKDKDGRIFTMIKMFLKEGDIGIDVGANIGLMSLVMSHYCGKSGKVISIEPGPVSSALQKRNLFVNGAQNTVIVNSACTDFLGTVSLFINPSGESDNQVHKNLSEYKFRDESSRLKVEVKAETLDHIISKEAEFNRVKFVKIDTQGHDYYVLKGGEKLFSQSKDIAVLCEYAPYLKSWEIIKPKEFFYLIRDFGFDVYDTENLKYGCIDLSYILDNYGFEKIGKYTDLLLLKGECSHVFKKQLNN